LSKSISENITLAAPCIYVLDQGQTKTGRIEIPPAYTADEV
jgi:hypothetical protein